MGAGVKRHWMESTVSNCTKLKFFLFTTLFYYHMISRTIQIDAYIKFKIKRETFFAFLFLVPSNVLVNIPARRQIT
jgi:hypothetical protein